jgi:hypothetical protein
VALAGPRREHEQHACAALARDRSPLVGIEPEELTRLRIHRLVAAVDAGLAVDHEHERGLLHLVLSELLSWSQRDQDDATLAVA